MTSKLVDKLITSEEIQSLYPLDPVSAREVDASRRNIEAILRGDSDRKILIIGPCSADFRDSLIEYAKFLSDIRTNVFDRLEIVMRFYTGKPRSI